MHAHVALGRIGEVGAVRRVGDLVGGQLVFGGEGESLVVGHGRYVASGLYAGRAQPGRVEGIARQHFREQALQSCQRRVGHSHQSSTKCTER